MLAHIYHTAADCRPKRLKSDYARKTTQRFASMSFVTSSECTISDTLSLGGWLWTVGTICFVILVRGIRYGVS